MGQTGKPLKNQLVSQSSFFRGDWQLRIQIDISALPHRPIQRSIGYCGDYAAYIDVAELSTFMPFYDGPSLHHNTSLTLLPN